MSNPTEERKYYFKQNFAFSTNYLNDDWKIPDFRGRIARAVPLLVMPNGVILDEKLQPLQANALHELIQNTLADDNVFVCNDAVLLHRFALRQAADNEEHREAIWSLTDRHALWEVCLLEQRIVWGTEGRVIERPDFERLLDRYQVPKETLPPEGLCKLLIAQFDRLVGNLPFLMNDLVGRRIFDPDPPATTIIPAPTRVLARDVDYRERLHIFMPLIEGWMKYGPACIGIDVQGAIAKHYLDQQDREIPPDSQRRFDTELRRLRSMLQDNFGKRYYAALQSGGAEDDESQKKIHKLEQEAVFRHWNEAFGSRQTYMNKYWDEAIPSTSDTNGQTSDEPEDRLVLVKGLGYTYTEKYWRKRGTWKDYRFSQRNRRFPLDESGIISLNPDHWGESIPQTGPLRVWADYHAALKATRFGNRFSHTSFPYLKSNVVEYAERYEIPLLSVLESSNRVLLKFRIRDIDLLSYLRTYLETDFICETETDEPFSDLRHLTNHSGDAVTRTEWCRNDLASSLAFPELEDGKKISHRVLLNGISCSRDFWEATSYFAAYRFFGCTRKERDTFLATILSYGRDKSFWNEERWGWYLPDDCRDKLFLTFMRLTVKGLLRGFSGEMIAEQIHSRYDMVPATVPVIMAQDEPFDIPFSYQIERIQLALLSSGRFRGTLGSSLLNTVLPRFCVDPVFRKDQPNVGRACLRLDGEWREDDRSGYSIADPMAREAAGDVTDYNLLAGRGEDYHRRFINVLLPFIEERCRMLGIDTVEPSQNLLDRLMLTNAISRNGKPGRPVYEFEYPYTAWMETFDDLKKSIAYSVVRHSVGVGCVLAAVSEESFIVDAERGAAENIIAQISSVIQSVAEQVLDLKAGEFGNFVEVTDDLSVWLFAEQDRET